MNGSKIKLRATALMLVVCLAFSPIGTLSEAETDLQDALVIVIAQETKPAREESPLPEPGVSQPSSVENTCAAEPQAAGQPETDMPEAAEEPAGTLPDGTNGTETSEASGTENGIAGNIPEEHAEADTASGRPAAEMPAEEAAENPAETMEEYPEETVAAAGAEETIAAGSPAAGAGTLPDASGAETTEPPAEETATGVSVAETLAETPSEEPAAEAAEQIPAEAPCGTDTPEADTAERGDISEPAAEQDPFQPEAPLPATGETVQAGASATGAELTAKGKGKITSITSELINGYTAIRFVIDGRYEGTICGLAPDTTEAEALEIAKGAAAQLYAGDDAGEYAVADAERYTGLTDRAGAAYDEQMRTVRETDEALATETDPVRRAELRDDLLYAYYQMASAADGVDLWDAYDAWEQDPENAQLRKAVDDILAEKVAESATAYEQSRGYEETNTVYAAQTALIDAEKLSYTEYYLDASEHDSNLCWAASAADMLWYSGWGAQAVNPQTGETFKSEDELLKWFAESFENAGAKQDTAIQYLFKGITPDARSLGYAALKDGYLDPDDPNALLAQYAADMLVSITEGVDRASGIAAALSALDYGSAIGCSIYDMSYSAGHAVTAFGRIVDLRTDDPAAALKAIFIADSDSDVPALTEAEFNGGLQEDGQQQREDRVNMYEMIRTGLYTDPYSGATSIRLEDYAGWLLSGVTLLTPYTEEVAASVTETDPEATKNAANTPDLIVTNVGVLSTEAPSVLDRTYEEGETLVAVIRVKNESMAALKGNGDIPAELTLYRVNPKTGAVEEAVETISFLYDRAIAANGTAVQRTEIASALSAGTYRLEATGFNADHTVTEAFYINNLQADGYTFTVIAIPVPKKAQAQDEKKSTVPVYRVFTTVIGRTETAHIAFVTSDGNGGFTPFETDIPGAALWYGNSKVDPALWAIGRNAEGTLELLLEPEYLMTLETGRHEFTLRCKDARVIFDVVIAPALGA